MSIFTIATKRIAISTLALGSILSVACTQSTGAGAPQDAAEKTGDTKQALRDPGCIIPGYTDVSAHDSCYNEADTYHDAAPNTDKNSPGYCPDQAVFELDPYSWRRGFTVIPKISLDPSSIFQLDSQYDCENIVAHVSVMTTYDPPGTNDRFFSSRGDFTQTYRWAAGRCQPNGWSANAYIEPSLYKGIRVTGEMYWNTKNKGEGYSLPSRVTLVNDGCIF